MDKVTTIRKGCPICGSDLKGNRKYKYLCKRCNILFGENEVKKSRTNR